ncbi:MAG: peptidylprolyl isomerase [Calditrichaeota bacterium]|nr:peptidylprolyl isomerase [Calditrichota bacterium]
MKKVFLLLLLSFAVSVHAEEVIDRILAVVDDEIILESEVLQYLQYSLGASGTLENLSEAQMDSLGKTVLEDLIAQKLLLTRARRDSVMVTQKEVDRELDSRVNGLIEQVGGQEKLESYYGMPLPKIKRQFRPLVEETLLIERIRRQQLANIRVSRSEVLSFWDSVKDSVPPLRDAIRLAHILLEDRISQASIDETIARADSAREVLATNQMTFEEYASRYSDDPGTAARGGKLGTTNRGDLVPEYEEVAYALEPGEISKPVVSQFGVHLIRLNERTGEKINTDHVLFKVVPALADQQQTITDAESLVVRLRNGADFAELALALSQDTKTASNGGDLGWFSPAELPDEFRAPLEGKEKGDITEPFRTDFGVHIIKVTDRVFSRKISLEEDYSRIEQLALAKKQDEEFRKWIGEVAAETYVQRK